MTITQSMPAQPMPPQSTARIGLPGLPLPDRGPATRPDCLLRPGSVLLRGVRPDGPIALSEHRRLWGPVPSLNATQIADAAHAADLRGHGGAGFPTAVKLRSIAGSGAVGPVVVNGAEGEHASAKDGVLLRHTPHLVLDGAVTAARALGSGEVIVRVATGRPDIVAALRTAFAERKDAGLKLRISVGPDTFVAGEASAVIRSLAGGPALPDDLGKPPRMPGLLRRSRPVLLSNTETFARLAAASRGDFRRSVLVTVSGAVAQPGVVELPAGATVSDAVELAGGLVGAPSVLVTGGWHGAWVGLDQGLLATELTREALAAKSARLGAGVLIVLPDDTCPVTVLNAVARMLADESAGQCGPCVRGLPALADAVGQGRLGEVAALSEDVSGRGLCAHPSASAKALKSAVALLRPEFTRHAAGTCCLNQGALAWHA